MIQIRRIGEVSLSKVTGVVSTILVKNVANKTRVKATVSFH